MKQQAYSQITENSNLNQYGGQQPQKRMMKSKKQNMNELFKDAEEVQEKVRKYKLYLQKKTENNNLMNDLDDLDNIFESSYQQKAKQTPQVQQKSEQSQNLKNIWAEETPTITPIAKNIEKKQIDSNIDYLKLDLLEPGELGYKFNFPKINLQKTTGLKNISKRNIQAIDGVDVRKIQKLLFQCAPNKFFPNSWAQGFIFREEKWFGLLQKEGGPCGIIACVQAYFLKWLLFIASNNKKQEESFYQDKTLKENCLIASLADILWKCSDQKEVKIAVIKQSTQGVADISNCGYVSIKAQNFEKLYELIHEYKEEYLGDFNNGVTTFLYSVILTHGVEKIISEVDMEDSSLIAHHGHASQEAVNLLLTGRATSNCFDGEKDLDSMILKGTQQKSEFGFLTIFEHYKYMEVGTNLKTPFLPIWVICKEYHYSVIFAKDCRTNENFPQKFDVIYYDELYNTDDKLLLTVSVGKEQQENLTLFGNKDNNNQEEDDLTPTLELVMRTKWGKNIKVDWNDSTPIL